MSSLFLFIVVLQLLSLSQGFLFGGPDCDDQKDCVSCTSHESWSGKNCRWCPRDQACHADSAIFANPCPTSENVVNKADCSSIVYIEYDRKLAYTMLYLSALAYTDDVANYIAKATAVNTFRLVKQVTKSCPGNAKCSGYTAVSHIEKAIVIAFRGSQHSEQIIHQAVTILLQPKVSFQAGGKVQGYFNNAFLEIWKDLNSDVDNQILKYPTYKVWVTGHSLGGALASLASTVIANDGKTTKNNFILYTFGQPRVGDHGYALAHDKLVPRSFRVTHYRDPVVHLPTCINIGPACSSFTGGPYHHGKEIYYGEETMTKYSSYKKCEGLPHNEDLGCSNSLVVVAKCVLSPKKCMSDHAMYFGIRVGQWWKN